MYNLIKVVWTSCVIACMLILSSCKRESRIDVARDIVQQVTAKFIPDDRIDVFRVQMLTRGKQIVLKGETNIHSAKTSLFRKLDSANISYVDSLTVLPVARVDTTPYALVNISVANLRKLHRHSAELVTQALLGMPLKVLNEANGWYLVMCPDHYIGWVDDGGIALYNNESFNEYKNTDKVIITQLTGTVYSEDSQNSGPVTDVVAGDILALSGKTGNYYHISLPDGRTGYINMSEAMPISDFIASRHQDSSSLVLTARSMLGIPYLWGGTSSKGMDCSGFTKTVYLMNGLILPRDADQQANVGVMIDSVRNFRSLKPGDLLFFGKKTAEGEDITHVGMWIGNMQFINSSGMIKIASMDSLSDDFDRYNYNRYIKANRIIASDLTALKIENNLFSF